MSRSKESFAENDKTEYDKRRRSARTGHILIIIIAVVYLVMSLFDIFFGNIAFAAVKIGVSVFLLMGKSAARWVYCVTAVLDAGGNIVRFTEFMNVIFAVPVLYYIASAAVIVKSRSIETFYEMKNSNRY